MADNEKLEAQKQRNRERALRYYYENREVIKAKWKAQRDADPEAYRERQRQYRKANPEKVKQWRLNEARRLLNKEGITGEHENHK